MPWVWMVVLSCWISPGRAQEPEVIRVPTTAVPAPAAKSAVPSIPKSQGTVQEALADLWLKRKAYLEQNNPSEARRQVDFMREIVRREGILSATDLAGAFLAEGKRALESGNRSRALESFHLCSEFSPDEPGAFFGIARTLWSQERDFSGAISATWQGVRAILRNPAARSAKLGNLLLVLLAGSVAASAFWCLLCALATARQSQHDLFERRALSVTHNAAQGIAWAIWVLPALLWLSSWWLLVYWLVLSLPYLKPREWRVSVGACLCFLFVLPIVGWIARGTSLTTDPSVRILVESARGGVDPERIPFLERMAAENPSEPLYHFLLGQTYSGIGSVEAALQEYRQVQSLAPSQPKAWINSGNLFFSKDQFTQAANEYRQAIQADPQSALGHFNLSLALQASLHLEEADAAFKKAREIDNALITSILASSGGEERRKPVDARYSGSEVLAILQGRGARETSVSPRRLWLEPVGLAGGIGLLGCLIYPRAARRWGVGRAQRCLKCGQPFCRKCQVGMRKEEGFCTACRHVYVLKDPVTPEARAKRELMVASHERWEWISRRLVSLILPGAGQIRGGRTLWGLFLLWCTCTGIASLLLAGRFLAYPGIPVIDPVPLNRIVSVAIMAMAWLAANATAFEKRS